jgi:hypothetical protein
LFQVENVTRQSKFQLTGIVTVTNTTNELENQCVSVRQYILCVLFTPNFVALIDFSAVRQSIRPVAYDGLRQSNTQRIHLRWSLGELQKVMDCSDRSLQMNYLITLHKQKNTNVVVNN